MEQALGEQARDGNSVVQAVEAALRGEPRINFGQYPIGLDYDGEVLTMRGEVEDVAAKKLALELAAAIPGVGAIVDQLHCVPAQPASDEAILAATRNALLQEPALQPIALSVRRGDAVETLRAPDARSRGWLELRCEDGVVTLDGEISSLAQKRLAGVLAWWVPGVRDVINGLGVSPPEEDNDDEITDAVSIVLSKDPFVNAGQLRVHTHDSVVRLDGVVHSDEERDMAERDAWYVFGVDRVENHVEVTGRRGFLSRPFNPGA